MVKTNDFLGRLYWAVTAEENYFGDGMNLGELYERTSEEEAARDAFQKALDRLGMREVEDELLNLYCGGCWANEKQGFINGFKLGMKLAQEGDLGPLPE